MKITPKIVFIISMALVIVAICAYALVTKLQHANTQKETFKPALVNFDDYEILTDEVKEHREERLVNLDEFNTMRKTEKVIILDTRSKEMYDKMHVKGAIHLNFSDFTQANLAKIIPSFDTKVLIYCNNNFSDEPVMFATKMSTEFMVPKKFGSLEKKPVTLALNIPTYINLYGYGYKNVFELSELVSVNDSRIEFEGTEVK